MTLLARVTDVQHLGARVLRMTFSDGLVRELDFANALPGVLASIDDDLTFAQVSIDSTAGTVAWPNGIDLDPDTARRSSCGFFDPAASRTRVPVATNRLTAC